jgi:hypothetical protein
MKPESAQAMIVRWRRENKATLPERIATVAATPFAWTMNYRCCLVMCTGAGAPTGHDVFHLDGLPPRMRAECADTDKLALRLIAGAGAAAERFRLGRSEAAWLALRRCAQLCWCALMQLPDIRVCRLCGCCDEWACEGGCHWVEPDLCSNCQPQLPLETSSGSLP